MDPSAVGDIGALSTREWLETNGLGGFASSTVAGLNTRRYHGLLVAALQPPVGRAVLLSKLDETLVIDGRRHDLSANQYPGAIHPEGFRYITGFRLDPFPVVTYDVEGVVVEKSIWMIQGRNATVVEFTFAGVPVGADVVLELRPLIAFRDFHGLTHENRSLDPAVVVVEGRATVRPYEGLPPLRLTHDADDILTDGYWYRQFEYARERERGLDHTEDLFNPLTLVYRLKGRARSAVIASADANDTVDVPRLRRRELARREGLVAAATTRDLATRALVAAADQFVATRDDGQTVIAGYHWFSDWGRDTMIALPGLTLTTGRFDVSRRILLAFARHLDQGLIPNRFPDAGEAPEYNTVDGTLWFVEAVRAFVAVTGDHAFVRERLYPALVEIITWHERGTRYGIRMDDDGLLLAGDADTQLTWMDAKIGDWAVTPRHGKPVEIQALWYNALRTVESLARGYGDTGGARRLRATAARARRHFAPAFWNAETGCLFDVVRGDHRDPSIRPNQIIAVSLPFTMLTIGQSRDVVRVVQRDLLTPYGLRTLAAGDPRYQGRYEGDGATRDAGYHQGAVWPWLIGPFITAYLKAHRRSAAARRQADAWLAPLRDHLAEAGIGQVSELFDGDAPHTRRGCIAQAWSVAEVLRATTECRDGVASKS
jgi:predicted glycogen debranching enzyme